MPDPENVPHNAESDAGLSTAFEFGENINPTDLREGQRIRLMIPGSVDQILLVTKVHDPEDGVVRVTVESLEPGGSDE